MEINSVLLQNINQTQSPKKQNSTPNGYDKGTFLQILVAQMKYQNPMEPESNTEYIAQYATFSQIEQLSNMSNMMTSIRADLSLGKTVNIIKDNPDGSSDTITGRVEKVSYIDNVPYVSINGQDYLFDKITDIFDEKYLQEK